MQSDGSSLYLPSFSQTDRVKQELMFMTWHIQQGSLISFFLNCLISGQITLRVQIHPLYFANQEFSLGLLITI